MGKGLGDRHRPASMAAERRAAQAPGCLGRGPCLVPLWGLPNLLEHRQMARELAHEFHNCQM